MLDNDIRDFVEGRMVKKSMDFFHTSGRSSNSDNMLAVLFYCVVVYFGGTSPGSVLSYDN